MYVQGVFQNSLKRLAIEITKDKILNPKKDPIQPIMDIIHGAVMKYDIATVGCGLDAVTEKAVIDLYKDLDNENVSAHFCGHLGRAGRYAVHAGEQESAIEIIGCLKDIGTLTIEKRYDKAAKTVAPYIEMIGTFAAEKRLRFVTCDAMESLKDVGILAAENQLEDVTVQSIDSLGNVGMYAAENKIEIAVADAAKYLGCVGKCAAENELESAANQAVNSLGVVGNYAAKSGLEDATQQVAESLGIIGYYTVRSKEKQICIEGTMRVVESLTSIGVVAAEKGFEFAVLRAAQFLAYIGIDATQIDRLEKSVLLEDIVLQAAQSLVKLTNLSKYVKEAIECPKPTLSKYGQDYDRQSFMKVYERELEKSRTKVSK